MKPNKLSDLKYLDTFNIDTASVSVQVEAERVFNEFYGADYLPDNQVVVKYLFSEVDEHEKTVKVYEAYKDSGSEEYIYLTSTF